MSNLNSSDSFVILSKSSHSLDNNGSTLPTNPLGLSNDSKDDNIILETQSQSNGESNTLGKLTISTLNGHEKSALNLEDMITHSNSSEKFNSYDELWDLSNQNKVSSTKTDFSSSNLAKASSNQHSNQNISHSLPNSSNANQTDLSPMLIKSCPLIGQGDFSILGESFENTENMDLQALNNLTDSNLIQIQKQMIQLREDNCKLVTVLQANNQAMKKNLKIAQGLKNELDLAQKSYVDLKISSEELINQLKAENTQLRDQIKNFESFSPDISIKYGKLNLNQELNLQDTCAKIIEKDQQISALTKELNELKTKVNETTENDEVTSALKDQCETYFKKYKLEENSKSKLAKENQSLKDLIEKLRKEKFNLEEQLEKSEPVIDVKSSNNQDSNEDALKSERSGHRHRRRHHLKKLEMRMKEALPVINPGIIFQGFKQYRTHT